MKSLIILFLCAGTLSIVFSGCNLTDPDWKKLGNAVAHMDDASWGSDHYKFVFSRLEYAIDSVNKVSDSSLTIYGHIRYDSILIIRRLGINYYEDVVPLTPQVNTRFIIASLDTLDFRTFPDPIAGSKTHLYKFSIKVSGLKSKTLYKFCVFGEIQDKMKIADIRTCNSYKTNITIKRLK